MICFNCKRQIPDNVPNCPNCGAPIVPHVQIGKEIKVRRWQRWIFYVIFIVLFLGAVGFAVYIYNQNTALLNSSIILKNTLTQSQTDLQIAQASLSTTTAGLTQAQTQLQQAQQNLSQKDSQLQETLANLTATSADKANALNNLQTFQNELAAINPNVFYAVKSLAVNISATDLARIPVADYNLGLGKDADQDGLSDEVEASFGTDPNKADTDADSYNDKSEILSGYNPLIKGSAKLPIDLKFSALQKGKLFRQAGSAGQQWYWYVGSDGKRQYLGLIDSAINAFKSAVIIPPAGTAVNNSSSTLIH